MLRSSTAPSSQKRPAPQRSAPPRLPPLGDAAWPGEDSASLGGSALLLEGLRRLDVGRPATTGGAATERSLRSISNFGRRANVRAEEASCEILAHEVQEQRSSPDRGGFGGQGSAAAGGSAAADAGRAFDQLVAGIDAALGGGDAMPARVVRRDESVNDTVPMNGSRHYRIPLPSRPTAVTVTVVRTAGAMPTLWGSTRGERPTARNHDFKGKEDKLVYEHALYSNGDDPEEDRNVDRRHAVPDCRDLFVTAEADGGETTYKLLVTFGPIKIVLSREEIASQVQKMRRGWEAKLADLQRDANAREQFDEKIMYLQDKRAQRKQEMHKGMDFVSRNTQAMPDCTQRQRLVNLQKQALRGFARHDKVKTTREELDTEDEKRRLAWLNRGEERKRLRELKEIEDQQREERIQRQREWLKGLALVTFTLRTAFHFKELRDTHEFVKQQMGAAGVLHRFWVRNSVKKRRNNLYKNVVKLRSALSAYARVVRPAVFCSSQPVVKGFIETYAFHKEMPTLGGTLRHFRGHVVLIQRWFRQVQTIRQAFIQLFLPLWMDLQQKLVRDMCEEDYAKKAEQEKYIQEVEQQLQESTRTFAKKGTVAFRRVTLAGNSKLPNATEFEAQMPPEEVIRWVLHEYIMEMQRSRDQRIQQWEEEKKIKGHNTDLEKFGVQAAEAKSAEATAAKGQPRVQKKGKPGPVYKDEAELEALVRKTAKEWKAGDLRYLAPEKWDQWSATASSGRSTPVRQKTSVLRRQSASGFPSPPKSPESLAFVTEVDEGTE